MRKIILTLVGLSILGGTTLGGFALNVQAVETINSQANVSILGGPLSINGIEEMNFGNIELNGKDQIKTGDSISVTFSDYRGSNNEGFELTVKSDSAFDNKGLNLKLNPTASSDSQVTLAPEFEVTNELHQVVIGEQEKLKGTATDYDVTVGNELIAAKSAKAGSYQSILTWNLTATPNE